MLAIFKSDNLFFDTSGRYDVSELAIFVVDITRVYLSLIYVYVDPEVNAPSSDGARRISELIFF